VSPGCDNCYAEGWSKRSGLVEWGPHAPRRLTSPENWAKPLKWNRKAAAEGRRYKVFCASLADVFDNHASIKESWRSDLWELIAATPHLDWLLLTKRPQNIRRYLPDQMETGLAPQHWGDGWPNVWLGTTVENQTEADRRIPVLLSIPAKVRFLSCEPMLGPLDLRAYLPGCYECGGGCGTRLAHHPATDRCVPCQAEYGQDSGPLEFCLACGSSEWEPVCPDCNHYMVQHHPDTPCIDWVICGGESGPGARPMHPDWARSLRDQCVVAGVPFLFKQWGEWGPGSVLMTTGEPVFRTFVDFQQWVNKASTWVNGGACLDTDGNHLQIGGDFMRARDEGKFPVTIVHKLGKKRAGRLLDGRTWDEVPA
jgi:protein gp37